LTQQLQQNQQVKDQRRRCTLVKGKNQKEKRVQAEAFTQDRINLLNSIGFTWDFKDAVWWERYQELELYYSKKGHCRVPIDFPDYPRLGVWIHHQRRQYKLFVEGKSTYMTAERVEALERLGFNSNPKE